jgi:hypothetical protein
MTVAAASTHHHVPARAERQPGLAGGRRVAGRPAAALHRDDDLLLVPAQRERHEMSDPVLIAGGDPDIGVLFQLLKGVGLALLR